MTKPVHPTFWPKLLESREEAPGARTFAFASPEGFHFIPGQFLMFHFADDPKTWRAYSVCSDPLDAGSYFEITVAMVGAFSERLGALKPGLEGGLVVRGPFGKWIYDGSAEHAVLVSGGSGLTPFRAMCLLKAGDKLASRITVCYSAKTQDDLLYQREYDAWRAAGVVVHVRTTRAEGGARWTAESVFAAAADKQAVYYICGPNKMVQELRDGLQLLGVPAEQVRTEKWGDYTDLY